MGIRRKRSKSSLEQEKLNHSPQQLWDGVLRRLGAEIGSHTLEAWVRPLEPRVEAGRLRLMCPSAFHRERVRVRLLPLIARHIEAERGAPFDVELVVSPPAPGAVARPCEDSGATPDGVGPERERVRRSAAPLTLVANAPEAPAAAPAEPPLQLELPYRFENFVVGRCNALAREAGLAVARGEQRRINPLYVYARAGLGKTHLARAIAVEAMAHSGGRVVYASAEGFTNEFLAAIRGRETIRFKRRYREGVRLLVLDGVQFLRAKRATQLELFHTVAHLIDSGARVVLTGDRLPRDFQDFDPSLRSQHRRGAGRRARAARRDRASRDPAPQGVGGRRSPARRLPRAAGGVGARERARSRERVDPAGGERIAAQANARPRPDARRLEEVRAGPARAAAARHRAR